MKKRDMNKTVGYGWVGRWRDGPLGWMAPEFIYQTRSKRKNGSKPNVNANHVMDENKFTLCRITIEACRTPRGRITTRTAKALGKRSAAK